MHMAEAEIYTLCILNPVLGRQIADKLWKKIALI